MGGWLVCSFWWCSWLVGWISRAAAHLSHALALCPFSLFHGAPAWCVPGARWDSGDHSGSSRPSLWPVAGMHAYLSISPLWRTFGCFAAWPVNKPFFGLPWRGVAGVTWWPEPRWPANSLWRDEVRADRPGSKPIIPILSHTSLF